MKKLIFILLLAFTCSRAYAQKVPDYSPVKNGTNEQKIARANEAALQAATYLLSVPPDTNNTDVKDANSYLIMWMTETADYTFELDATILKLYEPNTQLLSILLAAMVEYEMKNPAYKNENQKVKLNAVQKLIKYVQTPANKVSMPDGLKKAAKADKNGDLDKYLASLDKK